MDIKTAFDAHTNTNSFQIFFPQLQFATITQLELSLDHRHNMIESSIPSERKRNNVKSYAMKIVGRQCKASRSNMVVNYRDVDYPKGAPGSYGFMNVSVKSNHV